MEKNYENEIHKLIQKKYRKYFKKNVILNNGYRKIAYSILKESFIKFGAALIFWQFMQDITVHIKNTPEIFDNLSQSDKEKVNGVLEKLDITVKCSHLVSGAFCDIIQILD